MADPEEYAMLLPDFAVEHWAQFERFAEERGWEYDDMLDLEKALRARVGRG